MNIETRIVCPHCGYEYLPSEIFFKEDFLENVTSIVRDENNKIFYTEGDEPCLEEDYCCDHCGKNFTVKAKVEYITSKDEYDEGCTISLK